MGAGNQAIEELTSSLNSALLTVLCCYFYGDGVSVLAKLFMISSDSPALAL